MLPWQRGLVVEYMYLITEGYWLGNVLMTLIGFTSMVSVPSEVVFCLSINSHSEEVASKYVPTAQSMFEHELCVQFTQFAA